MQASSACLTVHASPAKLSLQIMHVVIANYACNHISNRVSTKQTELAWTDYACNIPCSVSKIDKAFNGFTVYMGQTACMQGGEVGT